MKNKCFAVLLSTLMLCLLLMGCISLAYASQGYSDNKCLSFDGQDDYLSCGSSTIFHIDNCTIELWFKPKYTIQPGSDSVYGAGSGALVYRLSTMTGDGYALDFDYTTGSLFFKFANWATHSVHTNKAIWYNTTWYHVALTYDRSLESGNMKFYINGTLDSEHDHTVSIRHKDQQLNIGGIGGPAAYEGLLDELRVWNVAKTGSEIQETMMRTLEGSELTDPDLVGYWRFDEGSGNIAQDFSSYDNDATLLNDVEWFSPSVSIVPEFSLITLVLTVSLIAIPTIIIKAKIQK